MSQNRKRFLLISEQRLTVHSEQTSQTALACRLLVKARREEGLRFGWRSRCWNSFDCWSSWSWSDSCWSGSVNGTTGTVCTTVCAAVAVPVNNFVATSFQSFFSLATNSTVAVGQSTAQGSDSGRAAAAVVAANCVTDFVSSFPSNSFVGVIQTVDECVHNFRMAAAVVVTQFIQCIPTVLCIAIRHGSVDQLGNFACIFIAAFATG